MPSHNCMRIVDVAGPHDVGKRAVEQTAQSTESLRNPALFKRVAGVPEQLGQGPESVTALAPPGGS